MPGQIKPIHGLHANSTACDPADFSEQVWLWDKGCKPKE